MSKKKNKSIPPMEGGLLQCMKALDNQVAREMQRAPAEREQHGVQKWEPYAARVEKVAGCILDALGGEEISLDSLIILSQATAKARSIAADDLGEDGLGVVRSQYILTAAENIAYDTSRISSLLRGSAEGTLN